MSLQGYFITDRRRYGLDAAALVGRAERAARGGVTVIQVRERDLDDRQLVALVRAIVAAVAATPVRVLVNDRADIAVVAGAHGVHLRGDSVSAPRVRALAPPQFLIGRSVHSVEEVDAAVAAGGCDYLLFGTVFASAGKPDGHRVTGLEVLRDACRRSPVPVYAVGGIDQTRLAAIEETGVAGFAAVGMFMYSGDTNG